MDERNVALIFWNLLDPITSRHHLRFQVNKAQVYVRAAVVGTVYKKSVRARTTVAPPKTRDDENDDEEQQRLLRDQRESEENRTLSIVLMSFCRSKHFDFDWMHMAHFMSIELHLFVGICSWFDDQFGLFPEKDVSAPKTTGEVVNMMSTDCDRIAGFCPRFALLFYELH